ncbi:MAG: rfbF [Herbinix sp.]|jgi:GT2 family glycosyltransferase|nr:rfbF [Herbinix sp.]
MKKIAIILVNYNNYKDTIDCIESLLRINYQNIEVIIVDNCSSNNSAIIINEEYKNNTKIHLISSCQNLGFSGGNNLGISHAFKNSADYVLLLNNDTVVEKNFLDEVVQFYESNDKAGIVTGKIKYFYDKNLIWYAGGEYNKLKARSIHFGAKCEDNGDYDKIKEISFICGCYMFMSTCVLYDLGILPEEYFLYFEDTAYSLNALKRGYKLLYFPKSVIYHKVSASTGAFSQRTQYYFSRNGYQVVKTNYKGMFKYCAYLCYTYYMIKKIIIDKFNFKIVVKGAIDCFLNKMGKYELYI